MTRKVDPDVVDGVFGEELRKAEQAAKVNTGLNAFAALLLWLVAYGVLALLTLPLYAIGPVLSYLVLWGAFLALMGSTWLVWSGLQKQRQRRAAVYAGEADDDVETGAEATGDTTATALQAAKKGFLLPPHLTVQAIEAWRQRGDWSDQEREDAVALLVDLLKMPSWVPLANWQAPVPAERRGPVLLRLEDLDLLRRRGEPGRYEVRANPLFRMACGVSPAAVDQTAAPAAVDEATGSGTVEPGEVPAFEIGAGVDPLAAGRSEDDEDDEGEDKKKKNDDVIDIDL